MLESKMIKVGIAEMKIAQYPDALTTLGLGSCVGVVIYDPFNRIAGLIHVMLPDSTMFSQAKNLAKFADTSIPELIRLMEKEGALKSRLVAKIAGGSQMFEMCHSSTSHMKIGERNVQAVIATLEKYNIPIVSMDVGEKHGRTIEFYTDTVQLKIKTIGSGVKYI